MEQKLEQFLDEALAPYGEFPARADVRQELLANLQEKYRDLKEQGQSDEAAYQATVDSFGDMAEIMEQVPHGEARSEAKPHNRNFKASALMKADLSDTDLRGADFSASAGLMAMISRSVLPKRIPA